MLYEPGAMTWQLGTVTAGQFGWTNLGDTKGFGELNDGRPIWTGDFSQAGKTQILFYYPGDMNWWAGTVTGGRLEWTLAGNTRGFGQVADGRPFFIGDFTGVGRAQIMFYSPGDGHWFVGTISNNALEWQLVGTYHQGNFGMGTWVGDYAGAGSDQVMCAQGDGQGWLVSMKGGQLESYTLTQPPLGPGGLLLPGSPAVPGMFIAGQPDLLLWYTPLASQIVLGSLAPGLP
jgi:hypothetical protein